MTDPLTWMAVHAHPDDEWIGTGGSLARYREEGVRTVLVTATCGAEGEIVDPTMDPAVIQPKLGQVRIEELACSCRRLHIDTLHLLGYRDSGMLDTPANDHPDCFAQADLHKATGRLVRLMRRERFDPLGEVLRDDPQGVDTVIGIAISFSMPWAVLWRRFAFRCKKRARTRICREPEDKRERCATRG